LTCRKYLMFILHNQILIKFNKIIVIQKYVGG
jgi:hypothetical protein